MAEIERARSDVSHSDVRTQLDSVTTSLQEMLDTEAGEKTDAEAAFGDADFAGAAPNADNLRELEVTLDTLAENTDRGEVRTHLERARRRIAAYRTGAGDRDP